MQNHARNALSTTCRLFCCRTLKSACNLVARAICPPRRSIMKRCACTHVEILLRTHSNAALVHSWIQRECARASFLVVVGGEHAHTNRQLRKSGRCHCRLPRTYNVSTHTYIDARMTDLRAAHDPSTSSPTMINGSLTDLCCRSALAVCACRSSCRSACSQSLPA